jgi:hypothetical protein
MAQSKITEQDHRTRSQSNTMSEEEEPTFAEAFAVVKLLQLMKLVQIWKPHYWKGSQSSKLKKRYLLMHKQ